MHIKKQEIIDLLAKNVLINESLKEKIILSLNYSSDSQIDALYYILKEANNKQDEYIKLVIKQNPNFTNSIKNFTIKEIKKENLNKEKAESENNEKNLHNLEEELINL